MWVRVPPWAPMNEFEKKQKVEAFKQKLLLTSKKEIIDTLVEQIKENAELKDLYRTSFNKGVERTKRYERQLQDICTKAEDNAKILEKIYKLLDEAGCIYPDTPLEVCVQGLLVDLETLRENKDDVETRKTEGSTN